MCTKSPTLGMLKSPSTASNSRTGRYFREEEIKRGI